LTKLQLFGTKNLKAVDNFPLISELVNTAKCDGLERLSRDRLERTQPALTKLKLFGTKN
jgi:hypothetical protein